MTLYVLVMIGYFPKRNFEYIDLSVIRGLECLCNFRLRFCISLCTMMDTESFFIRDEQSKNKKMENILSLSSIKSIFKVILG
jgi:hypothetical protein